MKPIILLFLLFSFSVFGNYAKLSEVETNSISTVFTRMKSCGNDCIKIPLGYDSNYHRVIDGMKNDLDNPIESKNDISPCSDKADCDAQNLIKVCTDIEETVYMALDYSDIYCSKITGYPQIPSGQKIVTEDIGLKTAYLAVEQSKKDAALAKKTDFLVLKTKLDSGGTLTPVELSAYLLYLSRNEQ